MIVLPSITIVNPGDDESLGDRLKKKVLIIDNDLEVCRQIKYSLGSITTEVYYALSVREGLRRFMEQEYCLVIMDIALAEADGQE